MNKLQFSDLTPLVLPQSVAMVGASERMDSIGGRTLENLTRYSDFKGELHLINATKSSVNGMKCLPSVMDIGKPVDLALVSVPAHAVIKVLEECGQAGVKFTIVFTSGFGEAGAEGQAAEARMREIVRDTGMRIYGPNCPGLNNINARLGFTFSPAFRHDRLAGPIGLATQGGGLGRTFLQSMERGVGTGLWCSAGNEVDLEVSDFIHYMAGAPDIRVIATCLEGIRNGPRFMQACQHAARQGKPVVAMKIGKSDYGIQAAQSHTAAIAGSAEINSAVFRELGVIEVDDMDELVDTAALLSRGKATGREKIAVYCFSGGTAALAADKIGTAHLELATFDAATTASLQAQLPSYAAIGNPVDTTADLLSKPEIGYSALKTVLEDPNVGIVLFPIPNEYGQVTADAAASIARAQGEIDKPIVSVWMSDKLGDGYQALVQGSLMPMRSISQAVRAIGRYVELGTWRSRTDPDWRPAALAQMESAIQRMAGIQDAVKTSIPEAAAKVILHAAGIGVPRSRAVTDAASARAAFDELGCVPVAMKVMSESITHKTEMGGVRLGVRDAAGAAEAFDAITRDVAAAGGSHRISGVLVETMETGPFIEVVIGVHRDPTFGHVCTFGLGGVSIELFKDVSRRLLPITLPRAHAMIAETRCHELLKGFRGKPAMDIRALAETLVKVSDLVMRHADQIEELEINPLAVKPEGQGVTALDAVLSIHGKEPSQW